MWLHWYCDGKCNKSLGPVNKQSIKLSEVQRAQQEGKWVTCDAKRRVMTDASMPLDHCGNSKYIESTREDSGWLTRQPV